MCGIAGLWHRDGSAIDRAEFERFGRILQHRGPDGRHTFYDETESLALSNNRLALVGPGADGDQPMSYGRGRWWITYNGEVYNFIELREELTGLGCTFDTETDTEVVLAAYLRWGPECQFKFNGMWAFAIWDAAEKTLFLSRDRFGVKPLYTYCDDRHFAFASEVKGFLALSNVDTTFDIEFLTRSLATDVYLQSTAETLLRGVKRLPAGHSLILRKGCAPSLSRWWNTLAHMVDVPEDLTEQVRQFRGLFDDACRIRLRTDARLAVSLSGGMDSTSVLATVESVRQGGPAAVPPTAYMAAFDDPSRDECAAADTLTRQLNVPVSRERVSPEVDLDTLDRMLWHGEDANSIHFGNWALFRAMRRDGIRVAMTGDGSDELFVAYPWHIQAALEQARRHERSLSRFREIRSIHRSMLPSRFNNRVLQAVLRSAGAARSPTADLLAMPVAPAGYPAFDEDAAALPPGHLLRRRLYFDFHHGILPWILHLKDAASMAHGVELRCPFMDWRIVCFALSLPGSSVIGGGFTKRLLREAMTGRLPDAIRTRTSKISFVDSESRMFWRMKPVVLETISTDSFRESNVWHGRRLRDAIEKAYETGSTQSASFFWKCVKTARLAEVFRSEGRDRTLPA